jgi:hypothetical protein
MMRGRWGVCLAGGLILFGQGCASQSPMDHRLHEVRRQVEMGCMRNLMEQGLPLAHFGESMMAHCRTVSRRTVR